MPAKRGCSRSNTRALPIASMSVIASPHRPRRVLGHQAVGRQDHQPMNDRLADEHAVERIAMQRRQTQHVQRALLVERQRHHATALTLGRHQFLGRFRQRQSPGRVLERDFPRGHRAEIHLVVGRQIEVPDTQRQRAAAADDPEKGAGVDEELHRRFFGRRETSYFGRASAARDGADIAAGKTGPDSNASRNSSGIGSKNESGTSKWYGPPPINRGSVRFCSTARNSATGWLRLQISTRSPLATASRYAASFALTS